MRLFHFGIDKQLIAEEKHGYHVDYSWINWNHQYEWPV